MVPGQASAPAEDEVGKQVSYRFANVEFDLGKGQLLVDGKSVLVEPRPLRLLHELLQHVNEVVTKEELREAVWDGRPTVDHVLANAVSKLRMALGEQAAERLQTLPRVGYRLAGPVHRTDQALAVAQALHSGDAVPRREAFVLERSLGRKAEGGVWLARHGRLGHQRVFKFADDGARLAALKREYTLFRLLQRELGPREDFVTIVEVNFQQAPFWLESEYGGPNLVEWAEQGQRLTAMGMPERLALFMQIAGAVAAAHGVGVLHKDIKPSNVLVCGEPDAWQARLTDFGSGRLLEPGRLAQLQLTATGLGAPADVASDEGSGTHVYLAPEVVAGQSPSLQSDVYALGVLLFQLSVGDLREPLATGWQRRISNELLVEDINDATEGAPADRLASAAELLRRLQQWPQRQAERAARQGAEQRQAEAAAALLRLQARRPWQQAALLVLGVGLAASLWLAMQMRQARQAAERQTQRAEAINQFVQKDMLGATSLSGLGPDGRLDLRAMLTRAAAAAPERLAGQPQALQAVHTQLGRIYALLTDHAQMLAQYDKALALSSPEQQRSEPELLTMRYAQARALLLTGRIQEGQRAFDEVVADAATSAAVRPASTDLRWAELLARIALVSLTKPHTETVAVAREMVALADAEPVERDQMRFVARNILGEALYRSGQAQEGVAVLEAAIEQVAPRSGVAGVRLLRAQLTRGQALVALGRLDEAEPLLKAAGAGLRELSGTGAYHLGLALASLGAIGTQRGDFATARQFYVEARDNYRSKGGDNDAMAKVMEINVAIAEANAGMAGPAAAKLEALAGWFERQLNDPQAPVVQATAFERARALLSAGQPALALQLLQGLKPETLRTSLPDESRIDLQLQAEIARAQLALGDKTQGQAALAAALQELGSTGVPAWRLARYRQALAGSGV